MALRGDLVRGLARPLGMSAVTVDTIYRHLREGGVMLNRGVGRSATKKTPREAAALLVGALGGEQAKDAAISYRRFAAASPTEESRRNIERVGLPTREFASLAHDHSFVDALESLIASAVSGNLQGLLDRRDIVRLQIVIQSPEPVASINIEGAERVTHVEYMLNMPATPSANREEFDKRLAEYMSLREGLNLDPNTDRRRWEWITARTIITLGELLKN